MDLLALSTDQVEKDAALVANGGGLATTGQIVNSVMYVGVCSGLTCNIPDFRPLNLKAQLYLQRIPFSITIAPGIFQKNAGR